MLEVQQGVDTVAEEEREQDPTKVLECKLGRREEGGGGGEKKKRGGEREEQAFKQEGMQRGRKGRYIQDCEQKVLLETRLQGSCIFGRVLNLQSYIILEGNTTYHIILFGGRLVGRPVNVGESGKDSSNPVLPVHLD